MFIHHRYIRYRTVSTPCNCRGVERCCWSLTSTEFKVSPFLCHSIDTHVLAKAIHYTCIHIYIYEYKSTLTKTFSCKRYVHATQTFCMYMYVSWTSTAHLLYMYLKYANDASFCHRIFPPFFDFSLITE